MTSGWCAWMLSATAHCPEIHWFNQYPLWKSKGVLCWSLRIYTLSLDKRTWKEAHGQISCPPLLLPSSRPLMYSTTCPHRQNDGHFGAGRLLPRTCGSAELTLSLPPRAPCGSFPGSPVLSSSWPHRLKALASSLATPFPWSAPLPTSRHISRSQGVHSYPFLVAWLLTELAPVLLPAVGSPI